VDPSKPIPEVVLFFKSTFAIVLALALAEAFKQSVSDKVEEADHEVIFWRKVPALCSFLLLIIPFYQGMSRYFFVTDPILTQIRGIRQAVVHRWHGPSRSMYQLCLEQAVERGLCRLALDLTGVALDHFR